MLKIENQQKDMIYLAQIFFGPAISLDPKNSKPKIVCGPNIFNQTKKILDQKFSSDPNFFPQISFGPKICFKIIFGPKIYFCPKFFCIHNFF